MSNNDQNEYPLPVGNEGKRRSSELLPRYFRTQANEKILGSTLDQMVQPGVAEKIAGYYGRKTAKAFRAADTYIEDVSAQRQTRQLEPATVVKDSLGNVEFYKDYPDFINQINAFGGNTGNHSLLNTQEYYAWNPNIDWDKLTNFREYYWLPNGPQTVTVEGQSKDVVSSYKVTVDSQDDSTVYKFSARLAANPILTLYRGQTYRFEINTPGFPFAFTRDSKFTIPNPAYFTTDNLGNQVIVPGVSENISSQYIEGQKFFDINGDEVSPQYLETGTIEFTVPFQGPEHLFYLSKTDANTSGFVKVFDIGSNTSINVVEEILSKSTYTSANGLQLSNGMKIKFAGTVFPEEYAQNEWYVEGVGIAIRLISEKNLVIPAEYTDVQDTPFDSNPFDRLPFGSANSFAGSKDYIVVNRSSVDRNAWSRYNRWFHADIIEASAEFNNQPVVLDQSARATRPILEFEAGLRLANYGTAAKDDVDLIDTFTTDVFSTIEGSIGYNIDGIQLAQGMRVLFTADPDNRVNSKIYKVNFITINNTRQLSLIETEDTVPLVDEVLLVTNGLENRGMLFWYNGIQWKKTQEKTKANQSPLFQLYDASDAAFDDVNAYNQSTFIGTSVFSYTVGTGNIDSELGFPLSYRTIENVGDIQFNFSLVSDSFSYQVDDEVFTKPIDTGYLRKYISRDVHTSQNGWTKAHRRSVQPVIRQYVVTTATDSFAIDVYNRSSEVDDLKVTVFLNHVLQVGDKDYAIDRSEATARVVFSKVIPVDDSIIIKAYSSTNKNINGYYELAHNLERNPLNDKIGTFTLGEANDHVATIVENINGFDGRFPGSGNLRDLGELDQYGTRFVQHSGPHNLAAYHITDKSANIIKALRFSRAEYAKFKRTFLQTAENLGFDGTPRQQVDLILSRVNADKSPTMPFYFSDMLCATTSTRTEHKVPADNTRFYAISSLFTLDKLSARSVLVYLNSVQLVHDKDYIFSGEGFVNILADIIRGDIIEIFECESTDGSYIPATPTKLGLHPAYIPQILEDNSYLETRNVIQGHDGSITIAFDDYRDNILLELERRIYNNIKQKYNADLLDINCFVPGDFRTTGYSQDNINRSMINDFVEWVTIAGDPDYTTNTSYSGANSFTFNYTGTVSPSGTLLNGYWRSVYIQAYDTARPHTHPWEMLGITVEPTWWESAYGPAPYTSNNLVLWEDLAAGIIRGAQGTPNYRCPNYSRPTLLSHIPVDSSGNLLSPLASNYAKNQVDRTTRLPFIFGDHGPVEAAWRRSAEYPFSLLTSRILNQPHTVFATGFDLSRMQRNQVDQIIYTKTGRVIRLADIAFPNTRTDSSRVQTSGLVNYIFDYLSSEVLFSYEEYKSQLSRVQNQLSIKVGGFTEKEKFKLILDSRTPFNEGNVFLPQENYQIFLNTSSPVDVASYSGVIVEKTPAGYIVKGYDREYPVFEYAPVQIASTDPVINIGGVSEQFLIWAPSNQYIKGQNVRDDNTFYRVVESHISGEAFDATKFRKLSALPQEGGRNAVLRRRFENTIKQLPYGTLLATVQDVVDFLLGYEEALVRKGFVFDFFSKDSIQIENWTYSVKEFLFWTTQNWAAGSVITLSPGAEQIKFAREYAVVDNLFDNFYNYSIYKADGKSLEKAFSSIARTNQNEFGLTVRNTADGIFHVKLPLVQKEHIILLDNTSVFGDVIYDLAAGYRQERIQVTGYRSDAWNGGLDIPGFIYDSAEVTDWTTWTDYSIGNLVKYKEFFYVALYTIPGSNVFVAGNWERLTGRPEPKLIPNFDNRINQFADFYDLDTDNFDTQQQKHAQHLIGYQKRNYLQNIINDDVSQYKFYQGFIQDKGTVNSLTKLFDALSSADKDSLEFYEEWAIRLGRYGATDNAEIIEFLLDESQFRLDPQPVSLVETLPSNATDLVYRQRPSDIYAAPKEYNSKPFPVAKTDPFELRSAGYVLEEDVSFRISNKADILNSDVASVGYGDYVWVVGLSEDWDVIQHVRVPLRVLAIVQDQGALQNTVEITFSADASLLMVGDYIGLHGMNPANDNFYKVTDIGINTVTATASENVTIVDQEFANGFVSRMRSVRSKDVVAANDIAEDGIVAGQRIWIDGANFNDWIVLENKEVYTENQVIENVNSVTGEYARTITASQDNKSVVTGDAENGNGIVYSYNRVNESSELRFDAGITPFRELDGSIDSLQRFGEAVALSADGKWLAVGSPGASNIASPLVGEFAPTNNYLQGDVVKYNEQYWEATRDLTAKVDITQFNTFNSYAFFEKQTDSTDIKLLLQGAPYLPGIQVSHLLVRAPVNQYLGTKDQEFVNAVSVADTIYLEWNNYTHLNRVNGVADELTAIEPFADVFATLPDSATEINSTTLSQGHEIIKKIDNVLFIEQGRNIPVAGDIISTDTAQGVVYERFTSGFDVVLYITEVQGRFTQDGTLYNNDDNSIIGSYSQPGYTFNPELGGYWMIATGLYVNSPDPYLPENFGINGYGLVYKDLILSTGTRSPGFYASSMSDVGTNNVTDVSSLLINLSYRGNVQDVEDNYPSPKWVIRLPKEIENIFTAGSNFSLWVNDSVASEPAEDYGFTIDYLNDEIHTVDEIWDGYVDFDFTSTQPVDIDGDEVVGDYFEPDGSLGVSPVTVFDRLTGATAEVAFYQRRNNTARIYLKNAEAGFTINSKIMINTVENGIPTVRQMGQMTVVSLANTNIGKMAVVSKSTDFEVDPETFEQDITGDLFPLNNFALVNGEYWIYQNIVVDGALQPASFPITLSRDWDRLSNVPVTPGKPRNGVNEQGVYHIYTRSDREWQWVNSYFLPGTASGANVAKELDFAQQDRLYTLFVSSNDRVYVIKNGVDQDGNEYDWAIDVDPDYRGDWSTFNDAFLNNTNARLSINTGEVFKYLNVLYRANTVITDNTVPGTDVRKWSELDAEITVEGFIPHIDTEFVYGDSTFIDSTQVEFATQVANSLTGQVVAITVATTDAGDSTVEDNRVVVYRIQNGRYVFDQVIDTHNVNSGFGNSIALSPNGQYLVIGEPFNNSTALDQGTVYVYQQIEIEGVGKFKLVQTLVSPRNDKIEKFGMKVSATDTTISVASFNGDIVLPTYFDLNAASATTFDNDFTRFTNHLVDTGSVTVYELIESTFIFADALEFTNAKSAQFGENLLAIRNHVYVGMPRYVTETTSDVVSGNGAIVDYRREQSATAWNKIRESSPVVDLDQIKEVFLYNKQDEQLIAYLDYVDVRQGKIAGTVDSQIDFKTFTDPARYNVSTDADLVNDTNNWEETYVGKVWWDMSTARFANPYQGDAIYQSANWNRVLPGASINLYEWVETTLLPTEWNELADTSQGIAQGVSGASLYGDNRYSQKLKYDSVAQTFSRVYFYWVTNKFTLPNNDNRTISVGNMARLISDPDQENYKFISFMSDSRFVLYNCADLISGTDVVLAVTYYTQDNQEQNIHTQYQLLTEGLSTSLPKQDIERKWVDSLVGYDERGRRVPDEDLSPRQKYGTLFRPRQSWFVNRQEALKQVVERANISLLKQPIVDSRDLTKFLAEDEVPLTSSRMYDYVLDSIEELRFIGTSKVATAEIEVTLDSQGTVLDVVIVNSGRGYRDPTFVEGSTGTRKGPLVTIKNNDGLEIELIINNLGQVVDYDIINKGSSTSAMRVSVRPVSVLIKSDSTIEGRWAIYAWNPGTNEWQRTLTQDFDVKRYWHYADWYTAGNNQFTSANHLIKGTYEIPSLDDDIGDVIKVENAGQGGWLLLLKVNDIETADLTVNYETIGRQRGTIQIDEILYDTVLNLVGFDASSYDSQFFDAEPSTEIRMIMQGLKEDILTDDLAIDYNQLFFSSVRYVFSEQLNVDWAFKTSFVRATHNIGELSQRVTYKNNSLPSYNDYVEEAKPYKTNIREYISALDKLEPTNSVLTDFDLPPKYDAVAGKIVPRSPKIVDNQLVDADSLFDTYPDKHWKDNIGFKVTDIRISASGSRYNTSPKVTITGGGGSGATAKAYVGQGSVIKVSVVNAGSGYTSAPTVTIDAPPDSAGTNATVVAILGQSVVRSMKVEVKFDRIARKAAILMLEETQNLVGTGANTKFLLRWPMDLRTNRVSITINGTEALRSEYTFKNIEDTTVLYDRFHGRVEFTTPPAVNAIIVVNYYKNSCLMHAADRIEHLYAPVSGMLGNDLSQLMTGVDYGGVEVRSYDFDTATGWDNDEWYTTTWDTYDTTYEDLVFRLDGSTIVLELDAPLETGITYNVYRNGIRIDDVMYDGTSQVSNANAIMPSLVGDGVQTIIDLDEYGVTTVDGDTIIIRKTTSDGSFAPDPDSYDTQLIGGTFDHGNATGLAAEDIIVDGDLFVTAVTGAGPEELVPGQVMDTVDIKVFERLANGQGEIFNQNYTTNGVTDTYELGIKPNSVDAVIVKVNNDILEETDYVINYSNNTVTFDPVLAAGQLLTILTMGMNGENVLDINAFVSDGITTEVQTTLSWRTGLSSFVLFNGVPVTPGEVVLVNRNNSVTFLFQTAPPVNTVVDYGLFASTAGDINFSRVTRDTFVGDGAASQFELTQTPSAQEPVEFFMLVNVEGFIASPGYSKQFIVENPLVVVYQFDLFQIPASTIDPAEVLVFINKKELTRGADFIVNISDSTIQIAPEFLNKDDVIEAYYTANAEYKVTNNIIEFIHPLNLGHSINVYQFTNHSILAPSRIGYNVAVRGIMVVGSDEFTTYHNLRGGKILLRDPAPSAQYVWVTVNSKLLTPGEDYSLALDGKIVYLKDTLVTGDTIDVFHFAAPVATPRMAWSQFKDILNRTHYKRYDNDAGQQLATQLHEDDLRIEVEDASTLPVPDKATNKPGIIFIDGERIEYFIKDGNLLRQLRRGTLGTGVRDIYPVGTTVVAMGANKNIPYKDQTVAETLEWDGSTTIYETSFNLLGFNLTFGQTYKDFFEIFVGGRRLRKNAIQSYQFDMVDEDGNIVQAIAQDSPAGDIELEGEFDIIVDISTGTVQLSLTEMPHPDEKITMVRKVGRLWSEPGTALKDSNNAIAEFLRGSISKLPE